MPPAAAGDRRVATVLGTSVLLGVADRLISVVWQAAGESRAATLFGRQSRRWLELTPMERSMAVGAALLAAAASHVGLMVTHDRPAGWLWLVPPAIAASIGLLLMVWPRTDVKA